jgi:hypothetical protein
VTYEVKFLLKQGLLQNIKVSGETPALSSSITINYQQSVSTSQTILNPFNMQLTNFIVALAAAFMVSASVVDTQEQTSPSPYSTIRFKRDCIKPHGKYRLLLILIYLYLTPEQTRADTITNAVPRAATPRLFAKANAVTRKTSSQTKVYLVPTELASTLRQNNISLTRNLHFIVPLSPYPRDRVLSYFACVYVCGTS